MFTVTSYGAQNLYVKNNLLPLSAVLNAIHNTPLPPGLLFQHVDKPKHEHCTSSGVPPKHYATVGELFAAWSMGAPKRRYYDCEWYAHPEWDKVILFVEPKVVRNNLSDSDSASSNSRAIVEWFYIPQ